MIFFIFSHFCLDSHLLQSSFSAVDSKHSLFLIYLEMKYFETSFVKVHLTTCLQYFEANIGQKILNSNRMMMLQSSLRTASLMFLQSDVSFSYCEITVLSLSAICSSPLAFSSSFSLSSLCKAAQ